MALSSRTLRCSVLGLSCLVPAVCSAQPGVPQFLQPIVEYTGGRVTSFVPGSLQFGLSTQDILYVNAATGSGSTSSVLAGELLSINQGQGFQNLAEDQITFPNVTSVVAALADFNRDGKMDYAFALTRVSGSSGPNLCVFYGSGNGISGDAYDGPGPFPSQYPPVGGKSGCLTFPTQGTNLPVFSYIAAPSFQSGQLPQLFLEDSANNYLYVFQNTGTTANSGGILTGFTLVYTIAIPAADGAGPIYIGDFDHDGNTDFILNNQTSDSATVYFGNGDGTFQPPLRVPIAGHVHSMQLQDMNGDAIPDLVVENDNGVIQIYLGRYSRTNPFAATVAGGTAAPNGLVTSNGFAGNGGHLAAIDPISLDILTTTPIGLSVLQAPPNTLYYALEGIYNIGPGRSTFALGAFRTNSGYADLAVDSPEGVAIVLGDTSGDGGFQTSKAYSALAPALGATVGKFRNAGAGNNPGGYLDVVAATGAVQGQLLTNNGSGAFTTFSAVTNTAGVPSGVPSNLWSNVVSGDFNGDGVADIAYSLTGFPTPIPGFGPSVGPGLYVQFANGDGTFQPPVALAGASSNNNLYGETVVGDFDGNGLADLANTDWRYIDTLLGQSNGSFNVGLNLQSIAASGSFAPVAAGFFKENRTSKQDLVTAHDGALWPYLNSGNGTAFTAEPKILTAIGPTTLLLTDIDGDGFDDILLLTQATNEGSTPNQLLIWWGNGDGTFSGPQFYNLARNYTLGAVADMNSDGRPDIILSDGQIVSILYNLGNRTFKNDFGTSCSVCGEQHFLAGQGINSLSIASVTGTSKHDLIAANGGTENSDAIVLADNLPGLGLSTATLTPNPDVNTGGITVLANDITTTPVTGTLVATPNPSTQATAFTLTATFMSATGVAEPTGTVEFFVGTSGIPVSGFVPLTPGATSSTASFTVTAAANNYASGVYPISAYYSGDTNNSQDTLNGTLTITNTGTTTTLYLCIVNSTTCPATGAVTPPATPPPWPTMLSMYYGQSFNGITQATSNDGSALTGTVVFDDAYTGPSTPPVNPLCTLPVIGGACPAAIGTTVGTSVGVNVFTAAYSGDTTHAPSTSIPVTITVLPDTVTATITSSLNPAIQGQPVTFTATFTGNYAAPTGPVTFGEAFPPTTVIALLGTVNLLPGPGLSSTATFTTSALPVGTDSIVAGYGPTTDFGTAAANMNQVINPQASPSFSLAVTPTAVTSLVGEPGSLTVTVTALNGFTQTVNLSCSNLPYEASCIFLGPTITGSGSSTLIVSNTAPHTCGTTQPYFVGRSGTGGPLAPFAVPALAGLLALFLPGRRRWLRALVVLAVAAAAVQMTGCGNCTDLGTRPGIYTFQVTATFAGQGPSTPPETQSVPVTITVTI